MRHQQDARQIKQYEEETERMRAEIEDLKTTYGRPAPSARLREMCSCYMFTPHNLPSRP